MLENGPEVLHYFDDELFKDAIQKYPLSGCLLYFQTPSCNCIPKVLIFLNHYCLFKAIHVLAKDPYFFTFMKGTMIVCKYTLSHSNIGYANMQETDIISYLRRNFLSFIIGLGFPAAIS